MEHSPCARTGHGTAPPASLVREQDKTEQSAEAPPKPPGKQLDQALKKPQEKENTQKQHSQKHSQQVLGHREKSINEKRDEAAQAVLSKRPVANTSANAIAAAPVTTSSKSALGSPVFADLPVSSSSRSEIHPKLGGLASGVAPATASGAQQYLGYTSKAKTSSYDKMEALGGGMLFCLFFLSF